MRIVRKVGIVKQKVFKRKYVLFIFLMSRRSMLLRFFVGLDSELDRFVSEVLDDFLSVYQFLYY